MEIYDPGRFPYYKIKGLATEKRKRGNPKNRKRRTYVHNIAAFDIETTRIEEIEQSVMYVWQFAIEDVGVCIGRTWPEFFIWLDTLRTAIERIKEENKLPVNPLLVVWVHNLAYEWQWLSGYYPFTNEEVFFRDVRKPIYCRMFDTFELRCSYIQTNMSLSALCKQTGVKQKLSGQKYDYDKVRFPWTELTPFEQEYTTVDVESLVKAMKYRVSRGGDNLQTVPLTSTGYVRRECKEALKDQFLDLRELKPAEKEYRLLRKAFRGGNTHASRYYANKILEDLNSADISSSYPNEIVNSLFPVSKFTLLKECSEKKLDELIYKKKKAVLVRCSLQNVTLKDDIIPVPYIPTAKCRGIYNGAYDNGRVLSAEVIGEITLTDIDYKILRQQYDFDIIIHQVATARYGKLPKPLRDCVLDYYKQKTLLKDKKTGKVKLVRASYEGINKAFPKEHYRWAPAWVTPERTF